MLSGRRPTLPHRFQRSTIGAEGLNCRVRDGNGCDPLAVVTQNLLARSLWLVACRSPQATCHKLQALTTERREKQAASGIALLAYSPEATAPSKFYGQAERAISSGKLRALLRFHIRPIKQVVYLRPS